MRADPDRIHALLPQTQCTRCGYPDCRGYAQAIASGEADINRCPPGGQEGVRRLAALTGRPQQVLDPRHGKEGPLRRAVIDEVWCIGCTLCIKACPVDCIVGASKRMHTVIAEDCTGCELCLPACPVDCISLQEATPGRSGWDAWSAAQADAAAQAYRRRQERLAQESAQNAARLAQAAEHKLAHLQQESAIQDPQVLQRKRDLISAAIERARQKRHQASALETGEGRP